MLKTSCSFHDLINKIKSYQPDAPIDMVQRAFKVAESAHKGQMRKSGEEYIVHPIGVANILADLQLDCVTIIASLLHDVAEDTPVTLDELQAMFGKEVVMLVDGVTKLSKITYKSKEEQQLDNYIKMFLAMAKDIRVIMIKLADRLHNMRTLKHMAPHKQRNKAEETLEIFAPLANRLGMYKVKWELEDLSFRYLEPDEYYKLVEQVKQRRSERDSILQNAARDLSERLREFGIKSELQWRAKHLYSIWRKMQRDRKELSEIYDLSAIRLVVESLKDCYGALGIVHTLWRPIPGRFKDYVAMPKSNGYQSLHTTVVGPGGQPLEIQIRTWEMHHTSEYGIAAHWRYKETASKAESWAPGKQFDQKIAWLRQLVDWQHDLKDPNELMETIKLDVFADEVFVFTPNGMVVNLPVGSIPIDFAYRIHTQVGHNCVGAKINGRIVPLEYHLQNGDIVEIMTSKNSKGPSRDWLNIIGSSDTRNKIRQWFKKANREDNIVAGRAILEKEARRLGYELKEIIKNDYLQEAAKRMSYAAVEDMLAALGYGGTSVHGVMSKLVDAHNRDQRNYTTPEVNKLLSELRPKHPPNKVKAGVGILVKGESGLAVRLARCCTPVKGDAIVGYITRGKGVSIHRQDCTNILHHREDYERIIEVSWEAGGNEVYTVQVEVTGTDRSGLLTDIMVIAAENKVNITSVNAKAGDNNMADIYLNINVNDLTKLESLMTKFRRIRDVYSVKRVNNQLA